MHFLKKLATTIIIVVCASRSLIASDRAYTIAEYGLPDTLDPMKMSNVSSLVVSNLIYDGLVRFSPDLNIEPDISKSWETSKDGKIITFKLNSKAKFQNGERIEASDVAFSLNRLKSEDSFVSELYGAIDSVQDVSRDTVLVKLKWPYPPIFGILAGSTAKILPKKYASKKNFFKNPIGSGAFKIINIDKSKNVINLVSSENYFLTVPKLKNINLIVAEDENEAKFLAKNGKIDEISRWPIPSNDPLFKIGNRISGPLLETWIFGLVTTKKPFNNIKVRKSFRASFDREKFRKKFYPEATPAYGYIPLGIAGSRTELRTQEKIGTVSKDQIRIAFPEQLSRSDEMKKFIENEFNSKGWNVVVDLMGWSELFGGYRDKSFQAFFLSMNMDYPDADFLLKNFDSTNKDNFSQIKDARLDKVLKEMQKIQDKDLRLKKYNEAIEIVDNLALTINVFHPKHNYWASSCVRGMESNLLSSVYIDYRKIYFDESCKK